MKTPEPLLRKALNMMQEAGGGLYIVGVFTVASITDPSCEPTPTNLLRARAMINFGENIEAIHPLCLCCERTWKSRVGDPPFAFGFIAPYMEAMPPAITLTAICRNCSTSNTEPVLVSKMVELAQSFMPESEIVTNKVHKPHNSKQ